MVQINFARKEINCKIVYYGPGLSGKTTNLEQVHARAPQENKGELTSISTDGDRTLFFDFMPLDLGTVAGMRTKFHIYTVPGQVYYNSTRKLVLLGADGVIFVADSSPGAMEANKQSLENLKENLIESGKDIAKIPLVLQWNKRDVQGAMTVEEMERELNIYDAPTFEGVASKGEGVFQTLKAISSLVLESINSNDRKTTVVGGGAAEVDSADQQPAFPKEVVPAEETMEAGEEASPLLDIEGPSAPEEMTGPDSRKLEIERNHIPTLVQADASVPESLPDPQRAAAMGPVAVEENLGLEAALSQSGPATGTATLPEAPELKPEPVQPPGRAPAAPAKAPTAPQERLKAPQRKMRQPEPSGVSREKGITDNRKGSTIPKREVQVIGGKPKGKKKNQSNILKFVVIGVVILLLIGAGVAYFLMM